MTLRFLSKTLIVILVLGTLGALGWWLMPKKVASENRYITAALERGAITQTVAANGTLNPVKLVSVGSQISGIVHKLYVDFNDRVREGQVLLELDPALTRAQLQQSEANLASANASLELAQANEVRARNLYAQEYMSRLELDQTVQALKAAQAQVALVQAQVARDRINLGFTVIRSPVSGVVVSRQVDLGQTVAASLSAPTLFQIAQDLSKMQIDSNYAEADVGSIRVGQAVDFRVDAFPSRNFSGKVRQIRLNPTTLQNVVTYNVVIAVDNPGQLLMPGMTAYVNIMLAERAGALLVPNVALRFRPGNGTASAGKARNGDRSGMERGKGIGDDNNKQTSTVYVLENGQPKSMRIAVGITDGRMTEVLEGDLKESDKVIVEDTQAATKKNDSRPMRLF